MKKLTLATLTLSLLSGSAFAAQTPAAIAPSGEYRSTFTRVNLDPRYSTLNGVNDGHVSIDAAHHTVTIVIGEGSTCPNNAMCFVYYPPKFTVTLPITTVQNTDCSRTIKAGVPHLTGGSQELDIIDYTFHAPGKVCSIAVAAPTVVNFTTLGGRTLNGPMPDMHSQFYGTPLQWVATK